MSHFINHNKAFIKECIESTWLSPPKTLKLEDLVSLRREVSGAMYESLIKFIRDKTGAKTEATKKELKEAFDGFSFPYETCSFTSVDEKEIEVNGKKVKKKVTSHGTWLRVKDAVEVARQSARVHAAAGHLAWGANVPAHVYPLTVMIDAGNGRTVVVLKHPCVMRADSVRSITLLGILIGTKDTRDAIKKAFGPIYDALSTINEVDSFVSLPWAPQLPTTGKWELTEWF
jgi:hypothetical protein